MWYFRFLWFLVCAGLILALPVPVLATDAEFNASTTANGYTEKSDTVYSTVWAGTTAETAVPGGTGYIGQNWNGYDYSEWRAYAAFDTSSIPDTAVITSATLKIYGYQDASTTDFYITVQNGQPTYPHAPVVVGDYNKAYYSGDGGSLTTVGFSTSGYNSITLNADGMSWISLTGVTKFCLRSSRDISGAAPSGNEFVAFGSTGVTVLEVTYTELTTPTVSTDEASNVAVTTARLNATVVFDGGEACDARWGWGETSEVAIEDYDNFSSYSGSYTTGQHPYYDVDTLSMSTTYYFRVELRNNQGTDLGDELDFTTESGVGDPSGLRAYPSSTSIELTWSKGEGATNSIVRARVDAFPSSYSDGTLVYSGVSSSFVYDGLSRGRTYYIAVWGESGGVYSSGSAQVLVTTLGGEAAGETLPTPTEPLRWLIGMDYTNMSNLPIFYDTFNYIADVLQIPRQSVWFSLFMAIALLVAIVAYIKSEGSAMITVIALLIGSAFGYAVKQIPLAIPVLMFIITAVLFFVRRRETG